MRYVAAFLLSKLGGNENPSADDIRRIIESVGVEVDEGKLSLMMEKLKGKNADILQEEGLKKLATFIGVSQTPETPQLKDAYQDGVETTSDKDQLSDGDDQGDSDDGGLFDLFS